MADISAYIVDFDPYSFVVTRIVLRLRGAVLEKLILGCIYVSVAALRRNKPSCRLVLQEVEAVDLIVQLNSQFDVKVVKGVQNPPCRAIHF